MATTNMNTRSIILRSFTTKVRVPPPLSQFILSTELMIAFPPDTKEEDLIHPEDIEHFRKHDEMDAAAERQEQLDRMQIVEQNIPQKFRRY